MYSVYQSNKIADIKWKKKDQAKMWATHSINNKDLRQRGESTLQALSPLGAGATSKVI